jgi:hypothetical protein
MTHHDNELEHAEAEGQAQPETGISQDPSTNTAPPSNPEVDDKAVEQGKDKLDSIVNW